MSHRTHTILNVEDNEAVRFVRNRILAAAGFRVEDAANGADALRRMAQLIPELVLLDAHLPDMDGFEVCRRIRAGETGKHLVIVHISTEAPDPHSQAKGLDNGADAYLTEPVEPKVLVATLRALLRARAAKEELAAALRRERRTSARLHTVLESTTDCVFHLEPDWRLSYLNQHAIQAIARGRDLVGRNLWDAFPEAVRSDFFKNYEAAMRDRKAAHFEAFYPPLETWFEVHAYPDPGGGLSVYFRDVTERRQAQAERERRAWRQESERQLLWKLIENAPVMISMVRAPDFVYELVNPAFRALAPGQEMLGQKFADTWADVEADEPLLLILERVISTGNSYHAVDAPCRIRRYPGTALEQIFVTFSWIPLYGPDGKPDRVLTVANETTASVRQREKLQQALSQNEAIIANISDGLMIADPDGNILSMNPAALQLLGLKDERALRNVRNFPEFSVHELDGTPVPNNKWPLARVLHGETLSEWEVRVTNAEDGGTFIGSYSGTPIRDEAGHIILGLLSFHDITQRKRVERELRLRTAELESLLSHAPIGFAFFDREHRYVRVNDALARMNGIPLEASLGRTIAEVLPEIAPTVDPILDEIFATGRTFETEVEGETPGKPGVTRNWLTGFYPVFGENRAVASVGAFVVEISERKRAERELRESEQRLARTQDIALVMALHISLDGRWLKLPPTFARFLGYDSVEELLGRPFKDVTHPDDFEADWDQCQRLLRGEIQSFEMEKRFLRKDGSITWGYINSSIVTDAHGVPVHFLTYVRDVNAQKHTEEALRRSEEELRQLADSIPHATWVMSPDGAVQYLNRRYFEYTGLSPEEAYGSFQTRWAAIHPEDADRYRAAWTEFLRTGNEMLVEYRLKGSDSAYRWKIGRAVAVRDAGGAITRYFGTITDIHNQKIAEEALRQAQKLESIGLLAGGIAHDFNNLLGIVLGNAGLLAEKIPEQYRHEVDAIIEAGERAADLTRQLLAYSGKGRFIIEPVDLSRAVREMTDLLHTSIPKKVRLHVALEPNLPAVEADPGQIQQIVMNLVLNAAEAIPENDVGVILVRTSLAKVSGLDVIIDELTGTALPPGSYIYLEVRDSGKGMDEETKAKIFDPFFTTKFVGRGLGLPAVGGVVKAHRGAIKVMSAPGSGTSFTVYLPASQKNADSDAPVRRPAEFFEWTGSGTILVVDDEQMLRDFTRAALEKLGYTVLTAKDGHDAVRVFEENCGEVDLVLLDLLMPKMDGREAARALREKCPDLKIILMSGYNETEAVRLFGEQPLAHFLQKPFTPAQLGEQVKTALGVPKT